MKAIMLMALAFMCGCTYVFVEENGYTVTQRSRWRKILRPLAVEDGNDPCVIRFRPGTSCRRVYFICDDDGALVVRMNGKTKVELTGERLRFESKGEMKEKRLRWGCLQFDFHPSPKPDREGRPTARVYLRGDCEWAGPEAEWIWEKDDDDTDFKIEVVKALNSQVIFLDY